MVRSSVSALGFVIVLCASLTPARSAFAGEAEEAGGYASLPPPSEPLPAPGPANANAPAPAPVASEPAGTTTTTSAALPASGEPAPIAPAPIAETSEPDVALRDRTSALDDSRFSLAPVAGFATQNLDLGVGVRAGAAPFIVKRLWVGGSFTFHAGHTTTGEVNGAGFERSANGYYVGPEVGYDVELGPVLVRPYAGIGLGGFTAFQTNAGVSKSNTDTRVVVWPGITALYGFPRTRFFAGGDSRVVTVPGGPAFAAYGIGGMTF